MTESIQSKSIREAGQKLLAANADKVTDKRMLTVNSGVEPGSIGSRTTLIVVAAETGTTIFQTLYEVRPDTHTPRILHESEIETMFDSRQTQFSLNLRIGGRALALKLNPEGFIESFEGDHTEIDPGSNSIVLAYTLRVSLPTLQTALTNVTRGYSAVRSEIITS